MLQMSGVSLGGVAEAMKGSNEEGGVLEVDAARSYGSLTVQMLSDCILYRILLPIRD